MTRKRRDVELDPAVTAVIEEAQERSQERAMTPAERKKAKRRDKRKRVTWELDTRLVELVRQIGEAYNISLAGTTNFLLADALRRFARGEISLDGKLENSRSPRYEWVVKLDFGNLDTKVKQRLVELSQEDRSE